MKSILRRRPSPALVIACIALFVSLSGVSYGVSTGFIDSREIKNNSVTGTDVRNNTLRTFDIRNNEVRGFDVRNSSLQGRDIAFNTLTGDLIWESVEITNRQFGPGYAPPVIYEAGGKRQLIAFPPDALVSLCCIKCKITVFFLHHNRAISLARFSFLQRLLLAVGSMYALRSQR